MKFVSPRFLLSAIMMLSLAFGGCAIKNLTKKTKDIKYKIDPEVLEVHGDSIKISMRVTIPPKTMHRKASFSFEPSINHSGDKVLALKSHMVYGKTAGAKIKGAQIIDYKDGGSFTYVDKVAYTPELKKSELVLHLAVKLINGDELLDQCLDVKPYTLTYGTITTSLTAKNNDEVIISNENFDASTVTASNFGDNRFEKEKNPGNDKTFKYFGSDKLTSTKADRAMIFYFTIDQAVFGKADRKKFQEQNKAQLAAYQEFIKTKYKIGGILVRSYASPDGEAQRNKNLSEKRGDATSKFVKGELKKMGYAEVNDANFYSRNSVGEDWEGLNKAVAASDITNKAEIMEILNSGDPDEVKEQKIKGYAKGYDQMRDEILPSLRRSVVTITAEMPLRPLTELQEALKNNPGSITSIEKLFLAQNTPDLATKLQLYQEFADSNPNDWRGPNNMAAVLIKQGKYDEALTQLDKANTLSPNNGIIANNYGVIYKNKKDYAKADEYYKLAAGQNIKTGFNMGNLYLVEGLYPEAIGQYDKDKCHYNSGLAFAMNTSYDESSKALNCIQTDQLDASVFYLKAILGARTGNSEELTTNLTRAINLDSSYKAIAKEDLEFRKFWEKAEFKNVVNK